MDEGTKIAVSSAIRTEKASYNFYRRAAAQATDLKTRDFFVKLASEEYEHMTGFIRLHPEGERAFAHLLDGGAKSRAPHCMDVSGEIDNVGILEKALAIAIQEEKSCIDLYSGLVGAIRNPEMHRMFSKALDETHNHLQLIEAEYVRICENGSTELSQTEL